MAGPHRVSFSIDPHLTCGVGRSVPCPISQALSIVRTNILLSDDRFDARRRGRLWRSSKPVDGGFRQKQTFGCDPRMSDAGRQPSIRPPSR